ncbi:MAG: glycosyltransferase family 4 protein [Paracoccaceae bacterium]
MFNKSARDPGQASILIVAENASNRFGGEAVLPLKYFVLLADRGRRVHLVTHERNREELAADYPDLMNRISFCKDTWAHKLIWAMASRSPTAIADHFFGNMMGLLTNIQQKRMVKKLIRKGHGDIVHQPIPVSPKAPSLMYGFGVPVIIGPMNGGMTYPKDYEYFEGRLSRAFIKFGRPMASFINLFIPGKRRAAMLLVANKRTREALPSTPAPVFTMTEIGVEYGLWDQAGPRPHPSGHLKMVFVGRLVELKGVHFVIQAMAKAKKMRPNVRMSLDIIGDGVEREALETMAREQGVDDRIVFHGFKTQPQCMEILGRSDALVLASVREAGGTVLQEAMAMGLAVLATDWGGPTDYVDAETGILVNPTPAASFADRLADKMIFMATNRMVTYKMGCNGAEKAYAKFRWEAKIDEMERYYAQALTEQVKGTRRSLKSARAVTN